MVNFELLFGVVPALILFLYGIEHFSEEIKHLAGQKFRDLIGKLTKNPVNGSILGAIITSIVQSSTATTVITVSLVNAGIISFSNSLGILFGSNVGTTITAQLVALKLTAFAPVFIIIGFILTFFTKKYKILGKPFFYFGLVFYALNLVSHNIAPIKADPTVIEMFTTLTSIPIALLVGFIFTTIVQSSSVTTGLIIVLAQSDLITLRTGIPLLLGANIGTSTTALLSSFGLNLHARRTGVANLMFNLIGALLLLPFLYPFMAVITSIGGSEGQMIANAHLIFNIIATVLFLFTIKFFTKLVEKVVPGEEDELLFKTKFITEEIPKSNLEAFKQIKNEMKYALEISIEIFKQSIRLFKRPKKSGFMRLQKLETLNDYLDEKIEDAILKISARKLNKTDARKTVLLVQMSNVIEQLGDLGEDLGDVSKELFDKGADISYESIEAVDSIFRLFKNTAHDLKEHIPYVSKKVHNRVKGGEERMLALIIKKYEDHLELLQEEEDYHGSTFVESISVMESSVSKLREIRKLCEKYTLLKKPKKAS